MSNITKGEAASFAKTFPLVPLFGQVIITLNKVDNEGLQLSENILSDRQFIIAKGANVTSVTEGDEVLINIEKLMVPVKTENVDAYQVQMQVKIDPIEFDGQAFAIIEDRVLKAKYK